MDEKIHREWGGGESLIEQVFIFDLSLQQGGRKEAASDRSNHSDRIYLDFPDTCRKSLRSRHIHAYGKRDVYKRQDYCLNLVLYFILVKNMIFYESCMKMQHGRKYYDSISKEYLQ